MWWTEYCIDCKKVVEVQPTTEIIETLYGDFQLVTKQFICPYCEKVLRYKSKPLMHEGGVFFNGYTG